MATRQENWTYNGLLGHTRRARMAMLAVKQHPLSSDYARDTAVVIEDYLFNLEQELRNNKRKEPRK